MRMARRIERVGRLMWAVTWRQKVPYTSLEKVHLLPYGSRAKARTAMSLLWACMRDPAVFGACTRPIVRALRVVEIRGRVVFKLGRSHTELRPK